MQFESGLTKYAGRLPRLDLSNLQDTDLRWNNNKMHKTVSPVTVSSSSSTAATITSSMNKHTTKTVPAPITPTKSLQKKSRLPSSSSLSSCSSKSSHKIKTGADGLPIDPRDWTRADVWNWLINMAISEGLDATPDLAQKFPMNGKALCLMSLDMYLSRVPVGGKMLYRDFRVRLARAMSL